MRRFTLIALPLLATLGGSPVAASPLPPPQGSWQFDITYDLVGIQQTFPGYSVTQCLDEAAPFPSISRPGDECEMQMQGHFGRTYTWMVNCSTEWEMVQGVGRIHYYPDRAHGDVHMQILNPHNPPQRMVFRLEGHPIGPCKE